MGILFVDDLFNSSGNKDVAVFEQQVFAGVWLGAWEANDGSVFNFIIFQFLEKNGTLRISEARGRVKIPSKLEVVKVP